MKEKTYFFGGGGGEGGGVGGSHMHFNWDPLGRLHLPPDPQLQSFLASPKTDETDFFVLSPALV